MMPYFKDAPDIWDLELLAIDYRGKEFLKKGSLFCLDFIFRGELSKFINNYDITDEDLFILLNKTVGAKRILFINNKKGLDEKFTEKLENTIRKMNLSLVGVVFFDLSCNNINGKLKERLVEISYRNGCSFVLYPSGDLIKAF